MSIFSIIFVLKYLYLEHNRLLGSIPYAIGYILYNMHLGNNKLIGISFTRTRTKNLALQTFMCLKLLRASRTLPFWCRESVRVVVCAHVPGLAWSFPLNAEKNKTKIRILVPAAPLWLRMSKCLVTLETLV